MTTLYDALRESHDRQRELAATMTSGNGAAATRKQAFLDLAVELDAHAAAEERFLYAPMLMLDGGLSVSRHALSEHHEMEEMVEELRGVDPDSDDFREQASALAHKVRHHLEDEEQGFFQLSGRLIDDDQKAELHRQYVADYARMKEKLASS